MKKIRAVVLYGEPLCRAWDKRAAFERQEGCEAKVMKFDDADALEAFREQLDTETRWPHAYMVEPSPFSNDTPYLDMLESDEGAPDYIDWLNSQVDQRRLDAAWNAACKDAAVMQAELERTEAFQAAAESSLQSYDFDGLAITKSSPWLLRKVVRDSSVAHQGSVVATSDLELEAENGSFSTRARFYVVFDCGPDCTISDPGRVTTVYAIDAERPSLVGRPVGLPAFYKTRIVVDVITLGQEGSLRTPRGMDVADIVDSVVQAHDATNYSPYLGEVTASDWVPAPRREGAELAKRLHNEMYHALPESGDESSSLGTCDKPWG